MQAREKGILRGSKHNLVREHSLLGGCRHSLRSLAQQSSEWAWPVVSLSAFRVPMRRLLAILGLVLVHQVNPLSVNEEYEKCKADGFGTKTYVCDVDKKLSERTVAKLDHLLTDLQDKIPCSCPDGCKRENGSDGYIGMLLVTDSNNSKSMAQDVKKIYREANLGTETCDHGLMLVYLKDTAQLATYRGGDSFVVLTDEDMSKLHELALKGTEGGDAIALQYLLQNYKDAVDPKITRAESWMPLVGLMAAILIVLLIMAILMALFLARFCCCCYKNKKEAYTVNTIPTYKTIEPLYVVAAPPSAGSNDRYPLHEGIYSTPYSGSPIPYPPPMSASRPITPSSTYHTRVMHPMATMPSSVHGTVPGSPASQRRRDRGEYAERKSTTVQSTPASQKRKDRGEYAERKSATVQSTPASQKRRDCGEVAQPKSTPPQTTPASQKRRDRGEIAEKKSTTVQSTPASQKRIERGEFAVKKQSQSIEGFDDSTYAMPPAGSIYGASSTLPRDSYLPAPHEAFGTIPRPIVRDPRDGTLRQSVLTESDLSFLDPNRKQETQTREELIY